MSDGLDNRPRCDWANSDVLMACYHDEEWGIAPTSDDALFEVLSLEIFQSGLSWRTILHKREAFRRAFAGFSIEAVARFRSEDVDRLLADAGIVRHRKKIQATIANARALQAIQAESGSVLAWLAALPDDPEAVYAALRPHLAFFGRTTCQSLLEAIGRVPLTHDPHCWRAAEEVIDR